jgi:prophage regulatory protein
MEQIVLIRKKELLERMKLKDSAIYWAMARGEFPRPIKIGPRAVAWIESEINDWIASRIAKRDADSSNEKDS